jgi:hypothetical protein
MAKAWEGNLDRLEEALDRLDSAEDRRALTNILLGALAYVVTPEQWGDALATAARNVGVGPGTSA